MLKVFEYRKKIKALKEEGNAILNKVDAEKRAITLDEQVKISTLNGEIDAVEARMDSYIKINRIPEEELRTYDPQKPTPGDGGAASPKLFRNLGEQLFAVRDFYANHREDPRLIELEKRAATGLNESIPSEGGFLVQTDFTTELLKDTYDTNEIPRRCRRIPISGPSNAFSMNVVDESSRATGSRWGGVQVYHEAEAASLSGLGSKPKFAKIEMKLEKIQGLCYATDENLQDAAQLSGIIAQAFPEEMGFVLSDDIIRGDGAGKCLGILNSPALVTIAKETGQAADTILTENILKMWKCRKGRNLVWLYNQELEDQLDTLTLAIGTGGVEMRLFQPPALGQTYGTMKGVPAIPVEVASGAGDVGDIILADLSQYILIDKGGIQTAESIHVEFLTGQTVFRFTYRVNGQSIRKNKITPYKRTDTNFYVSPFITLAAR
jgi:HK97 family phage major capsid protein